MMDKNSQNSFAKQISGLANKLSIPYLFIGNKKPLGSDNFIAKFKLYTSILLFKISFFIDNKNGALFFIAKCYQSLRRYDAALIYFKKTWDTSSYSPVLFKEIGTTCLGLKRFEEGLSFALKEVSQYPGSSDAYANLALFLLMLSRVDEAKSNAEKAYNLPDRTKFVEYVYGYVNAVKEGKKPIPESVLPNGSLP